MGLEVVKALSLGALGQKRAHVRLRNALHQMMRLGSPDCQDPATVCLRRVKMNGLIFWLSSSSPWLWCVKSKYLCPLPASDCG